MKLDELEAAILSEAHKLGYDLTKPEEMERLSRAAKTEEERAAREEARELAAAGRVYRFDDPEDRERFERDLAAGLFDGTQR